MQSDFIFIKFSYSNVNYIGESKVKFDYICRQVKFYEKRENILKELLERICYSNRVRFLYFSIGSRKPIPKFKWLKPIMRRFPKLHKLDFLVRKGSWYYLYPKPYKKWRWQGTMGTLE